MKGYRRCRLAVPMITAPLFYPVALLANEYSFEYGLEAGYDYNDNVRLSTEDKLEISGMRVAIPATVTNRTERLKASLRGELVFSRFNEDAFDSDDQDIAGRARYLLEGGELEGHAGFRRDSTRTSEFLDTGIVGLKATRVERVNIGGSGDHLFTERNGILGGFDYREADYGSQLLRDYKFGSGYGGWTYQWSVQTRLRLQAYFSRYDSDGDPEVQTDNLGAQFGFDSELSERWTSSLLVGWVNSETEYSSDLREPPEDDDSSGLLLLGTLRYRGERYGLSGKLLSAPSPSGSGTMLYNHSLDLAARYDLTERSRFNLVVTLGQRTAVDSRIDNDRDFARIRLGLDYRISTSWFLAGSYVYSYQDRELAEGSADSNAIYLGVTYRPEKSVWSR